LPVIGSKGFGNKKQDLAKEIALIKNFKNEKVRE